MNIYVVDREDNKYYKDVLPEEPGIEDLIIIVATDNDAKDEPVVGIISISSGIGDTYRIEHLFVAEEYRNRGIGSSLVSSARGVLKTMGGEALSASFYDEGYLKECLSSAHFTVAEENVISAAPVETVREKMERFRKKISSFTGATPLGTISSAQWEKCLEDYFSDISGDDVITMLYDKDHYDGNISMAALDPDGKCRGFLLLFSIDDDVIIDYLWANDDTGVIAMALFIAALDALKNNGNVIFDAKNPAAEKLAKKILKDDIMDLNRVISMVSEL